MEKLAKKEYWDHIYENLSDKPKEKSNFKDALKNLTRDFSNYVIWEVLLEKYLPKNSDFKILEIGCAPGKYLINFYKRFSYIPYGVEYSEEGVNITANNFKNAGLPPENIIKADFFNEDFREKNKEKYDLVFSRGFIEHFDNVKEVIGDHLKLLKKNGYLIIIIPNLSGINKHLAKFLNKGSLALHNTAIMKKKDFAELFSEDKLNPTYIDYVGIFSFGLFNTNRRWKYYLYRILLLIQRPFDFLLRILRLSALRSKYTSPYLIFIGRKK